MRFARRLNGLALVVVLCLCGSCDTTQPLQVVEQSLQLSFQAVNAQTRTFNVWDVFVDNDGDQLPDDGQKYLWCESSTVSLAPQTVPWTFSIEIKILRAGQTVAETVTSSDALSEDFNVAKYDTSPAFIITVPARPDRCTLDGDEEPCPAGTAPPVGGDRYHFRNARAQRAAHVDLMTAVPSPFFEDIKDDDDPGNPLDLGEGLCSRGNSGPANIDGSPMPYLIDIQKGDTVIVKARLADGPPEGGGLRNILTGGGISLSGEMSLVGRPINVVGTTSGTAVSFSYTAR